MFSRFEKLLTVFVGLRSFWSVDHEGLGGLDPLKICRRGQSMV